MTRPNDDDALFDWIEEKIEADRNADYSVTAQQAADLRKRYPLDGSDTPKDYKRFTPEQFFDGD